MQDWIKEQLGGSHEVYGSICRGASEITTRNRAFGPVAGKVLWAKGELGRFDPNRAVWIGGICSLFTADAERIRRGELSFVDVDEFRGWMRSWYPRIDQIHDCVGVPPRACKRLIYVVEDSFFAARIAKWTGLDIAALTHVIHQVHEELGVPAIEAWLRSYSCRASIEVVYTSVLEREIKMMLRIARRQGKSYKNGKWREAAVELMYSPLWLDVLSVSCGLISEPAHHPANPSWGIEGGNFFQIGFLPFWTSRGASRLLSLDAVPHRGNWQSWTEVDTPWTATNLDFNTPRPLGFGNEALREHLAEKLSTVYTAQRLAMAG